MAALRRYNQQLTAKQVRKILAEKTKGRPPMTKEERDKAIEEALKRIDKRITRRTQRNFERLMG